MADNAGSSSTSSNVSSRYSSDTEMMVKPKRPRISKDSKVSARRKNKMKFQKTKRQHCKHHRCHSSYGDHKKPTIGRGDPCSTRKRRHSPSSSSSRTCSEREGNSDVSTDTDNVTSDENYSEQECSSREVLPNEFKPSAKHKRKKAKLSPKDSKTSARNNQLRAVFRNYFGDLVLLISNPESLAAQLFSKSLISSATLDEIMTLPNSQLKKTLHLLLDLDRKIQADPEKLFTFIDVIQKDSSLEEVGERMSGMSVFCYVNGTLQSSYVWLTTEVVCCIIACT